MLHNTFKLIFLITAALCTIPFSRAASTRDTLDLSGNWQYRLLNAPSSIPGEGSLFLPNTLDLAHKSAYNPESDNTTQLRREFSFSGEATYSRAVEIPLSWKDKKIELFMERTRPSTVRIDGREVGNNSRISSPQKYDLSEYLTPGPHNIEIIVNNADSIPVTIKRSSHASSESTQTDWNGILGNFFLEAKEPFHIKQVKLIPDFLKKGFNAEIKFSEPASSKYFLSVSGPFIPEVKNEVAKGDSLLKFFVPIDSNAPEWSARKPNLMNVSFQLKESGGLLLDSYLATTGFRNFSTRDNSFRINNEPVFLRGTVNACVFPLTAHPPLDKESWREYFKVLKEYGFNHVRFHSWTPPEACFTAADEEGIYILTELPLWGEFDRDMVFTVRFLEQDLEGIIESYSNHPSFVLFSVGNELWGDISLMKEFKDKVSSENPGILTTYGSNVYLGMNGQIGDEDYIIAAKIGDDTSKSVRGSVSFADSPSGGYFNFFIPNSTHNYSSALEGITIPVIAHEVGQYQIYPRFDQEDAYSGILKPDNFKEFKRRAAEAGTLRKADKFAEASGKWASILYKAEMEKSLRTPGMGGFNLFGLQDYPGQGTCVVGILDPLMNSKGIISSEEWRNSNADLSIFAEFPRFCFYEDETVEIPVLISNYTGDPSVVTGIRWTTDFNEGEINAARGTGLLRNESIHLKMPVKGQPTKYSLKLSSQDNKANNNYEFWVYPKEVNDIGNVVVTDNITEALILLDQGEKVLLCPDFKSISEASLDPLFVNDFWNYRMYRTICDEMGLTPSPGTLGLLINETHPSLKKFPTENHTNWQWFNVISNSRPLIIDRLPKDVDPIVEVIDNVERNFRLALMLECNVGKGKLMILAANKDKLEMSPEGKWFLQSVKEYMGSKEFKPKLSLNSNQMVNLLTKPSTARLIKELKNETYNSHW